MQHNMNVFQEKITQALNNPTLQVALDANAMRRIEAREKAFASLPLPLEQLRQQAHQIRADVIAHLEEYLNAFIQKAQENGFTVHTAKDGAEARQIILEIAQKHDAKLIVKSKSMVSEEIGLNPFLEQSGITAVETDLGEYIVQLRGEHPSHIITPAVHLRRDQVGKTFQEKLGVPYTEDIASLTRTARKTLRQHFLEADIGLSGVNFGIAETGSICIVTNEGNGRMVTTIPPVHIALMGIERLVPSLQDLALMLQLLPRSATGQKISVYTQLIQGPRKPGEADGAKERHLILLDNGRRMVRNSPLKDALLCIRCGACLNACPVFREIGGHAYIGRKGTFTPYPGPIGSIISPALFGEDEFGHLAQASSLCGACKEACPIDIDLPTLLLRVRSGGKSIQNKPSFSPKGISWFIRLSLIGYSHIMAHPSLYRFAQKTLATISNIMERDKWVLLPETTGWGLSRDLPAADIPFNQRWKKTWQSRQHIIAKRQPSRQSSAPRHQANTGSIHPHINQDLVGRFRDELIALDGKFILCNENDLFDKLITLLRSMRVQDALLWHTKAMPFEINEKILRAGIHLIGTPDPNAPVGVTAVHAGIADTGSLLLLSSPDTPLTPSLLPETHIAIIRRNQLYPNLAQALASQPIRNASSAVIISGPSRTADIEMTLTIGVHGPGNLYVFFVQ